jgi:xanthine/CO dehydrogenase XdhC/CoxF family maturation factor
MVAMIDRDLSERVRKMGNLRLRRAATRRRSRWLNSGRHECRGGVTDVLVKGVDWKEVRAIRREWV